MAQVTVLKDNCCHAVKRSSKTVNSTSVCMNRPDPY